jgi:hypothetical protein
LWTKAIFELAVAAGRLDGAASAGDPVCDCVARSTRRDRSDEAGEAER